MNIDLSNILNKEQRKSIMGRPVDPILVGIWRRCVVA